MSKCGKSKTFFREVYENLRQTSKKLLLVALYWNGRYVWTYEGFPCPIATFHDAGNRRGRRPRNVHVHPCSVGTFLEALGAARFQQAAAVLFVTISRTQVSQPSNVWICKNSRADGRKCVRSATTEQGNNIKNNDFCPIYTAVEWKT